MKIDSHQHFWRYKPEEYIWINDEMSSLKRDYLPPEFQNLLTESGFEGSIAVQSRQSLTETSWLLELASKFEFIRAVVGWVDLCSENIEAQLSTYSINKKFKGVRHVLHDEFRDDFMLGTDFCNGIKCLARYDLTYDLLIFPKHLRTAIELVQRFPDQRFILDHAGKPFIKDGYLDPWKKEICLLAKYPNVYCKLSGIVTEADWHDWNPVQFRPYLDTVFETFGSSRIMIGSDWPVCTLAGTYKNVMNIVENYISFLSVAEKKLILGENAVNIYHLQ